MNSVQIINDINGNPNHVVWIMPFEKYQKLQGDMEQRALTPHEVVGIKIQEQCSVVCAWRKYLKLTQKEVAQKMGITQGAYSQIEKSENPQKATLEKIAKIFDIHIDLLTLED